MKNRAKKLFAFVGVPAVILGVSMAGIGIASAHGLGGFGGGFIQNASPDEIATRQQAMFEKQAQLIGVTVDDIKAAWASGKTMQDLMTEKGIKAEDVQARMKTAREAEMKTMLQALVSKGIITQAQADSRLQVMQSFADKLGTRGDGKMMRGFHGMGF